MFSLRLNCSPVPEERSRLLPLRILRPFNQCQCGLFVRAMECGGIERDKVFSQSFEKGWVKK